jgi:hypothetical protein
MYDHSYESKSQILIMTIASDDPYNLQHHILMPPTMPKDQKVR